MGADVADRAGARDLPLEAPRQRAVRVRRPVLQIGPAEGQDLPDPAVLDVLLRERDGRRAPVVEGYEAEFFVTNERELAFRKWMGAERPDLTLVRERFGKVEEAGAAYSRLLAANDDLDCCFIAWDVPALHVLAAIRDGARSLPLITVDLGNDVLAELRKEGPLKGVAAQRPYDQGSAAAKALLLGAIGRTPPAWLSAAGVKVTRDNFREAYEAVWHAPAPP